MLVGGGGDRLPVVQNPGQQGRPPLLPLSLLLASPPSLVADVVGVSSWEGERVGEGGRVGRRRGPAPSAALFPVPLCLTPAVPALPEVVQVIGAVQAPQQFQVSVLEEQRGGTDEDEKAHAHHHRPGQLHPLHVGATAATATSSSCELAGRRRRGHDIAGHRHSHAHQDHQHTQQQPRARR